MKRNIAVLLMVLAAAGAVASAATLTVPGDFPTITAALAAARPGYVIQVSPAYTGVGEVFPILVQINGLTLQAVGPGPVVIPGTVVVGAKKVYNPATGIYNPVRVTDVTVAGFEILGSVVVKEADRIIINGNHIYGGIRLLDAHNCLVVSNTVTGAEIGIFLEASHDNTFAFNTVIGCGLGLFVFESHRNWFDSDEYRGNAEGGVVLNNSPDNVLTYLNVRDNGGWGVRFVFSDRNTLTKSWVEGNAWGGIELLGSSDNVVEGNVVFNNGTANDGSDDAQIVVTFGDKAVFTAPIFDEYNELGTLSGFVGLKYDAIGYLEGDLLPWVVDLNRELIELRQRLFSAKGMFAPQASPAPAIIAYIRGPIMEWETYISSQTPSNTPTEGRGVLQRGFWNDSAENRSPMMGHQATNFTLPTVAPFLPAREDRGTLDLYEDNALDDFGLDRDGADNTIPTANDEMSWDKLRIITILVDVVRHHLKNGFAEPALPNLYGILVDLHARGLITDSDLADLRVKLNAAMGALEEIKDVLGGIRGKLDVVDTHLASAVAALEAGNFAVALGHLQQAHDRVDSAILQKLEIYVLIADVLYKLCLVNIELPRLPEVNSNLVGKKEKPFSEITATEITSMVTEIVAALNADSTARAIRRAVTGSDTWVPGDIMVTDLPRRASVRNTISSNVITTDVLNHLTGDRNIGIVIECPHNAVVNNEITNAEVLPIGEEPLLYGMLHRLDVAIILLADECLIAYNAIQWVDWGIIRGGTWKRTDLQVEYVFSGLAAAAYWPEPGWPAPGTSRDRLCCHHPLTVVTTCYTADDFDRRPVAWFPTLSVTSAEVDAGFATSQLIKRNRISLNFFDHVGVTIDNLDAESNIINHNLFYKCANGIRFRAAGPHPWYPDVRIGGAGANIIVTHNDFWGGVAVDNRSGFKVDASQNHTPPVGTPGHASVSGDVNPPAAPSPFAHANFLTPATFHEVTQWAQEQMGIELNMIAFKRVGLPPNLAFFYPGVVLPPEKPRHPNQIFPALLPGVPTERTFGPGLHMMSVPVVPVNNSPESVFRSVTDDNQPLLVARWDGAAYPMPTEIDPAFGYWLFLFRPVTIEVTGPIPASPYSVTLGAAGWHQVSVPKWTVAWNVVRFAHGTATKSLGAAIDAGWLIPFFYSYSPTLPGYVFQELEAPGAAMEAWAGYWIKTLVPNLTLIIPLDIPFFPPPPGTVVSLSAATLPAHMQPPAPPTLTGFVSERLTVMAYPNPVSGGQATFRALGLAVEQMRVTVLDVSGRRVWTGESMGNQLSWNLTDNAGRTVASGVYLYFVEARIGGTWVSTKLDRLLILR